ncbi:Gfo/Idh/MocA family protein [Gordoniibacillus kamchatkensis]|uniref:Gfo/Idh/MocA family protein n=1 Tax=Gordoniibacillus kamchatkensis TaxID=1590651 RepID=UPI000697181F|nr:Gfo/Idh/MocA family oxidoreductase [Paenibacillus sp. VKM B-2647]
MGNRDTYRVAIIGAGFIAGTAHIPAYLGLGKRVEIVAVADNREEACIHAAKLFQIPNYYTDPQQMLDECKPDLVSVCTANKTHKQWTIAALRAGAHVLCEKPIALNLQDAREMYEEADKAGRMLIACQNNRMGAIQAVKDLVDSGRLGDIYFAEIENVRRRGVPTWGQFHLAKENGGGPFCDVGVHYVDALMFILGNPKLISVSGKTWTKIANADPNAGKSKTGTNLQYVPRAYDYREFAVEDHAAGSMRFEGDLLVNFKFSWALNLPPVDGYRIAGTEGGLVYNKKAQGDHPIAIYTSMNQYQADTVPDIDIAKPGAVKGVGHDLLIEHIIDVLDGKEECIIKREEVLNVVAVMEAFYLSGKLNREVLFEEISQF